MLGMCSVNQAFPIAENIFELTYREKGEFERCNLSLKEL